VLAENIAGSSNYKSVGESISKENINRAVLGALKKVNKEDDLKIDSCCFGIAGNDTSYDMKIYESIIFNPRLKGILDPGKTIICNDSRIGLEAGSTSPNRIMVICGTGSNCFGINEKGEEAKVGGWDYILGDEGSGYSIAIKALKAVMKAYDGRGPETRLSGEILKYLGLGSEEDIVQWIYREDMTKEKISHISNAACRAAGFGDSISRDIFIEEAKEVEIAISTVAGKLGISNKSFDLVLVGSVFKCEEYFKKVLFHMLKKRFRGIVFTELTRKPVLGAIRLARNNLLGQGL
jgi:N-acetylglucosamine kinase-like BadF-type ATPase